MPFLQARTAIGLCCLALLLSACGRSAGDPVPASAQASAGTDPKTAMNTDGDPLSQRITADTARFVGLTAGSDGALVIALTAGTDPGKAVADLAAELGGRKHRVVTCDTTRPELERVRAEVAAGDIGASGYGIVIDPAICAVRLDGDIPPAIAEQLSDRYGTLIRITVGPPGSRAQG
ncbi:hypothetical protein ACQP2E_26425 [Actinoplanes sp. CA-015351]|uniref:hypothetical protein n=1 Tax=Actinoplanes sp. CA-015351 TaxID=3239897 RepID=UPI003D9A039D